MKQKLSVAMDSELVDVLEKMLQDGRFRNRSHLIEYALKTFLQGEKK